MERRRFEGQCGVLNTANPQTMWTCCQCNEVMIYSHAPTDCTVCGHRRCDTPTCGCKFVKDGKNRSRTNWDCCECGTRNDTVKDGFFCSYCKHFADHRSLFKKPPPPTRFNRKLVI